MPFTPGKPKTGGRQPGTPNRLTGAFKEAVQIVYNGLGGHEAFLEWARENPTEYYKIASRLIPGELRQDEDRKVEVIILPASTTVPVGQLALEDRSTKGK
jgi:hypothetical protein